MSARFGEQSTNSALRAWSCSMMANGKLQSRFQIWAQLHTCAGTRCRATHVAADFLRILRFFRRSSGIAMPPSLKNPVAPVALQLPGVSHGKLPLKRCRATGGSSSYTCGCRATLCNYDYEPALDQKSKKMTATADITLHCPDLLSLLSSTIHASNPTPAKPQSMLGGRKTHRCLHS